MGFIEEEHQPLFIPLLVSVLIHAVLFFVFMLVPAHLPKAPSETVIEVMTEPLDETKLAGAPRIADIDKPDVERVPKKAKFVGMYNSAAEQETVSKFQGNGVSSGAEKTKAASQQVKPAQKKSQRREQPKKDKLFNFDHNMFAMKEPMGESSQSEAPITAASSPKRGRVSIGDGTGGDYFPDVAIGDKTYLNVLRYPDVSYFVRLKRVFRTTFNPVPALRDYFSSNQVTVGSIDVVMAVSVDKSGVLSELFVLKTSGIPGYDREAMRTVRASAPFSQPPEKFLSKDGMLRMMWTFTVYL